MSELSYLKVFLDWTEATEKLNDADKGRLIDAMVMYARGDENADSRLKGNEAYLFPMFRLQIDRDKEEVRKKREANVENGSKGGAPKGNQNARKQPKTTQNNPKQPKTTETTQTKTTDNEERLLTNDELGSSCAEPPQASHAPSVPPVFQIPLNDNSLFDVTVDMLKRWKELYPAVNIEQSMRNIVGWCEANPHKRKTKNGVRRFVNAWLAKEQDNGGKGYQGKTNGGYGGNSGGYDWHNDPAYQGII